jgi:enoyl-CoA hydratase/3-hydroxyacyl-CoA dehydrogenase
VRALAERPVAVASGPVALTPLAPVEAQSANGQPLSREIMAILENTVVSAAAATTLAEALEIGYRAFGASACTAAAHEGIHAFMQGRKPDFSTTP